MGRLCHRWPATDPGADELLQPRRDLLVERLELDGSFSQLRGPFEQYRRTVEVDDDGVVETTDYHLALPWWNWLLAYPTRRTLAKRPPRDRPPWWGPPEQLDGRAASVLALLAAASLAVGYLNTLFTQTVAFAADEFGADDAAQGVSGTVVRFGIVFAIGFVLLADRAGRRRMLIAAAVSAPILCALGAIAPSFAWLTVTQTLGRPIAIAMGLIIVIIAAEEMPRNCRAYAISLIALSTGLGAGLAVIALPLADLGTRGWRLIYVLCLAFLIVARSLARRLPESRRFEARHPATPELPKRRFALLAASGFLLNLLVAPSSFFLNRYLKNVRGFTATTIAIFTLVTNTPAGVGVVAGGRLADIHGRRAVGAVSVVVGAAGTVLVFFLAGWALWAANTIGSVVGAASVPALGVYTAELFPTGRRGLANGLITMLSLVGSSAGLLFVGGLVDQLGYGPVMSIVAVGPLLVAAMVIVWYPETAHLELEQINPIDQPPPEDGDGEPEGRALDSGASDGNTTVDEAGRAWWHAPEPGTRVGPSAEPGEEAGHG